MVDFFAVIFINTFLNQRLLIIIFNQENSELSFANLVLIQYKCSYICRFSGNQGWANWRCESFPTYDTYKTYNTYESHEMYNTYEIYVKPPVKPKTVCDSNLKNSHTLQNKSNINISGWAIE